MVDVTSGIVGLGAGALLGRFALPQPEPFDVPVLISVESPFPAQDVLDLLTHAGIEYKTGTFEIPVDVQTGRLGLLSIVQVRAADAVQAREIIHAWLPKPIEGVVG